MRRKYFSYFMVATLIVTNVACSSDSNDEVIPPKGKELIVDHSSGLWEANITELPREATKESSAYINKVYDYLPANGQFVNELPKIKENATKEDVIQAVEANLVGKESSMITLGGFGGYVIFGFDHTVKNIPGKRDLRILGNAFPNSAEPGIIMVSYDINNNGIPDDPWFEIKGSEYDKATKNYVFTMYNPVHGDWDETEKTHIKWEDSLGDTGFIAKNPFHKQSYFPAWIKEERIEYRGSRLPNNVVKDGLVKLLAFEYGYADNVKNDNEESAIDIDWAVDRNGKTVHLPGIDFVKVYTGHFQDGGVLGETSTEVAGAVDLHVAGIDLPTREK